MKFPPSSKPHRVVQRSDAAAEIITSAVTNFSPAVAIPVKISQTIIGCYGMFSSDLKTHERVINGFQALTAAINAGALSALVTTNQECCGVNTKLYCQIALLSQLIYQGTLLASWSISEIVKDEVAIASAVDTQAP